MNQINIGNEFFDPIYIMWREGTEDDPYKPIEEKLPIDGNRMILSEIPDEFYGVVIDGYTEIRQGVIQPKQFRVNYANGVINFHEEDNGKIINIRYRGRGVIMYPASRIYHQRGDIVEVLDDLIEQVNEHIDEFQEIKSEQLQLIEETKIVKEETLEAKERAEEATDNAIDAYNTTVIVWRGFIDSIDNINEVYPYPDVGWSVQDLETGIRYRYDGDYWVPIDSITPTVPIVDESVDGLMKADDYVKLKNIPLDVKRKTLVFVLNYVIPAGVQKIIARFPYKGEIKELNLVCEDPAGGRSHMMIEKISYEDLSNGEDNWEPILKNELEIDPDNTIIDLKEEDFEITEVGENDYFRLNVINVSEGINGVNIQITVEI